MKETEEHSKMNPMSRTHITRLEIRNYRSMGHTDITFGPLTVLVGPNASGKSNVIDALRFVRDTLHHGVKQAIRDRGGVNVIGYRSAERNDIGIRIYFSSPTWAGEYDLEVNPNRSEITREKISVTPEETWERVTEDIFVLARIRKFYGDCPEQEQRLRYKQSVSK